MTTEQARDNMGLLKRVEQDIQTGTRGEGDGTQDWQRVKTRVELHDPQRALELLARVNRLVTDTEINIDLSIDDGKRDQTIADVMARIEARQRETVIDGQAREIPQLDKPQDSTSPIADDT